jgi:hypothetical protein
MQAFFFDYIFEGVGGQVFQHSMGIPMDFFLIIFNSNLVSLVLGINIKIPVNINQLPGCMAEWGCYHGKGVVIMCCNDYIVGFAFLS